MFLKFKEYFHEYYRNKNQLFDLKEIPFKYTELLLDIGGVSYNNGLYTLHTFESSLKWSNLLSNYFEEYKNNILPFAFDWWGRQYCVPKSGHEDIHLFDPVDLKDYILRENLIEFHNVTLIDESDILDQIYFNEAKAALQIDGLKQNTCVGYNLPLFLDGKANASNYKVFNLETYWDTQFQLYKLIKELPDGTPIDIAAIAPWFKL